jgi:hypothetical protein
MKNIYYKNIVNLYKTILNSFIYFYWLDTNKFHDVQFVGIEYDNIKYYSQDVTNLPRIYNYGRNINNINRYVIDAFATKESINSRKDYLIDYNQENDQILLKHIPYIHDYPEFYNTFNDIESQKKIYSERTSTNFFISSNKAIDKLNENTPNSYSRFLLTRIKVNAKLFYIQNINGIPHLNYTNISGEYIDVSISNPIRMNIKDYDNIYNYRIVYNIFNPIKGDIIYSYDIKYYIKDLLITLFKKINLSNPYTINNIILPYYNTKWEKRLKRYLLLLLIDICKQTNDVNLIQNITNKMELIITINTHLRTLCMDIRNRLQNNLLPNPPQLRILLNEIRALNNAFKDRAMNINIKDNIGDYNIYNLYKIIVSLINKQCDVYNSLYVANVNRIRFYEQNIKIFYNTDNEKTNFINLNYNNDINIFMQFLDIIYNILEIIIEYLE